MAGKFFSFSKKIYKKLPFNYKTKDKMKAVFYNCFSFTLKNTASYKVWNLKNEEIKRVDKVNFNKENIEKFQFNKSIAIQLHLYYIDLAEEFIEYFNNIPFKFDLLISIIDKKEIEKIKSKFLRITNVNHVVVKVVENRGRDVAPLLVGFKSEVLSYDYICHVHSKKSLYTGGEQSEWRRYLLDSLFGSSEIVRQHFYALENGDNVGIIYPETFYDLPYTGHTWLNNKSSSDKLLSRLNIEDRSNEIYIDYPMGTMFFAKVKSINQFFLTSLELKDFDEEQGQIDGTIAHAFERCLTEVIKYNKYNLLIYNTKTNDYVYNYGHKNLSQYCLKSYDMFIEKTKEYDVITFDIFDTLLSRKITDPESILKLIDNKINKQYEKEINFLINRKEAEYRARNRIKKDINIFDIYDEYAKICKDENLAHDLRNIEIETEKELIQENTLMINSMKYVFEILKKKVILISDMHLTKNIIIDMLNKFNIVYYDEIWVSNENNLRKDNGTAWEYLRQIYPDNSILHIGDNEQSDVHIPMKYKIDNFHVMSQLALFQNTNFGHSCKITSTNKCSDSVLVGLVLNKSFSEPFRFNKNHLNVKIDDFYELGYSFIGPTILTYLLWVIDETKKLNKNTILFFAREGYVIEKAFNIIKNSCDAIKNIDGKYLYVSRRALSYSAIKCEDDIKELLQIYYLGTIKDVVFNRFGIELAGIHNEEIRLPGDDLKVMKYLDKHIDEIMLDANRKREDYIKYYNEVVELPNQIVSDIGYSGTIQYYLSKVMGETYDGLYFATDEVKRPLKIEGNTIKGLFSDGVANKHVSNSAIHKYDLLFESILIAPTGQLLYIEDGKPVFTEDKNDLYTLGIEQAQNGILEFIKDYVSIMKDSLLESQPDKNIADNLIKALIENKCLGEHITKELMFEDKYCGNEKNNLIEEYFSV